MLWDGSHLDRTQVISLVSLVLVLISYMIVVDLRHVGITAWLSEVLKISVKTSVSCSA